MADFKRVVVSTTKDLSAENNGDGTLRKAIQEANKFFNDPRNLYSRYYIDFEASDGYTNSWVINPDIPLPPILRGNVYINYNNPKFVTITGENLKKSRPSSIPSWVKTQINGINRQQSSLLTFGTDRYLGRSYKSGQLGRISNWKNTNFHITNVNFSNNTAKGEDSSNGGGGGMGAGGGLSILFGKTVIENSIFQELSAEGGYHKEGWTGASGGKGSYLNNKNGKKGGSGGSGGLRGSFTSFSRYSRCNGGSGGRSGNMQKGWDKSNPKYLNASAGGNGSSCVFGNGGGGGGGGGGGSSYWGIFISDAKHGKGGDGGAGGQGGFGAGGGGGGGAGNAGFFRSSASGGRFGPGGEFGTRGNSGTDSGYVSKYYDYPQRNAGYGGRGGFGAALGGSIAVLHPEAELELNSVDFIQSTSKAATNRGAKKFNILFSQTLNKGQVSGSDIRIYSTRQSENYSSPSYETSLNDSNFHAFIEQTKAPKKNNIFFEAASYPRQDEIAKIRNTLIELTPGTPEISSLRFERPSSGMRNITFDASALTARLDNLYERIIPVESEEDIEARMKNKMISAGIELGADLIGLSAPVDLFDASKGNYTKSKMIRGMAAKGLLGAAKFGYSMYNAHSEYTKEIEENNAKIKDLAEQKKANGDPLLKIPPINVDQSRSLTNIKNFTIGEDMIYLDDFGKQVDPDDTGFTGPIIRAGAAGRSKDNEMVDSFEIHLSNDRNTSANTRIARITLDNNSIQKLNNSSQKDPETYIRSLLRYDGEMNRWIIGTMLNKPNRVMIDGSNDYNGGPAGELVYLNRDGGLLNKRNVSISTQLYDDLIYGSNGNEDIFTSSGNDQIFPELGQDTINGGNGFDLVNYQDAGAPIRVVANKMQDINISDEEQINSQKVQFIDKDLYKVLDAKLINTEVISAFGPSVFNLANSAKPNPFEDVNLDSKKESYYSTRSGMGSKIIGSEYDDTFIISLMKEENYSDYLLIKDSKMLSLSELKSLENHEINESADFSSSKYKILAKPAVIDGSKGTNQLLFMFDEPETENNPNRLNLAPGELQIAAIQGGTKRFDDFQAVINNEVIIAFIKNIDIDNIESFGKTIKEKAAIQIDGITLNIISAPDELSGNPEEPKSDTEKNKLELIGTKSENEFQGGDEKDRLYGKGGDDFLHGGDGIDKVLGGAGDDIIHGGEGDDKVKGGPGDDIIHGGEGVNTVHGGSGSDIFHLHYNGVQIIHDFDPIQDSLQLDSSQSREDITMNKTGEILHFDEVVAMII